jgi:hypothetical protein
MRLLWCLTCVFVATALSAALALEIKPYPEAKITEAQWIAYHDQVKAAYGPSAQEIPGQNLVVYSGEGISFAFTQAAHPAHPAWIARQLVQEAGQFNVVQIGYFAGQEPPFAELFRAFQALNQRMIEELKRQSPK